MNRIDYAKREVNLKVVYYGPALSGKTSNLQYIYNLTAASHKSQLVSLNTEEDRTLFFDFMPLDLGEVHGFKVRLHLYTVPGQVVHDATRKHILRGVDGVVFVADSEYDRMDDNLESLQNLADNLKLHGKDISTIPLVLQLNKRDLPTAMLPAQMTEKLNLHNWPVREGIATMGMSVLETMMDAARLVLKGIKTSDLQEGSGEQPTEIPATM